ncbi:MAG: 3-oxoacyl-ACP reductase FabG [Proteobacteria bacterium]|nr:3-oxoacyl-ACP reductase FabG [Pseudomonadota bacterium]
MRLKDKAALVTGAGSGIGKAIAEAYGREGAKVMCADRNPVTAEATAGAIRAKGGKAESVKADVGVQAECEAQVAATVEKFGRIDILVNNAGVAFHRLFLDTSLEDWERLLRINLTGQFLTAQSAARRMVAQGSGRIVNMGSISGQRGGTGRSAYGTAKAGLMQLTRVMAVELAPQGVVVNAIAPGPVRTPITNHGPEQTKAYLDRIPAGDYGKAENIAAAAVFLASDECQFVHGETLNVDGGFGAAGLVFSTGEMKSFKSGPKD